MNNDFTLKAAADLRNHQYHIVRVSAAETCNIASLDTNSAMCGILQNKPNTGVGATIRDFGISKVVAGAAITAGGHLTCNGSARAVAVGSGDMALAQAIQTAGADGDIIEVRVYPPVRWAGAT